MRRAAGARSWHYEEDPRPAEFMPGCKRELALWEVARMNPDVPLYSGGLMDAWPAWAVDAIAVCREEHAAIQSYLSWEVAQKSK